MIWLSVISPIFLISMRDLLSVVVITLVTILIISSMCDSMFRLSLISSIRCRILLPGHSIFDINTFFYIVVGILCMMSAWFPMMIVLWQCLITIGRYPGTNLFVDGFRKRLALVLAYLKAGLTVLFTDSFHVYDLLLRYFHRLAILFVASSLLNTFVCSATVFLIVTWSTRMRFLLVVLWIIFVVLWMLLAMLVLWPIASSLIIWLFILPTLIGSWCRILNVFYQIS